MRTLPGETLVGRAGQKLLLVVGQLTIVDTAVTLDFADDSRVLENLARLNVSADVLDALELNRLAIRLGLALAYRRLSVSAEDRDQERRTENGHEEVIADRHDRILQDHTAYSVRISSAPGLNIVAHP